MAGNVFYYQAICFGKMLIVEPGRGNDRLADETWQMIPETGKSAAEMPELLSKMKDGKSD